MNSISRFPTRLCAQSLLWAISFLFTLAQSSIVYAAPSDLDLSFGNRGLVQTDFSLRLDDAAAVLLQPDGRVVVVGTATTTNADFGVARYNPDGSLDLSFGNNGKSVTNLLLNDFAGAGILQPDGKIIIAGGSGRNFGLVRYNANGTLDENFGNGGIVLTDLGQALLGIRVVASLRQPDGKLVVVGTYNGLDICLARYNSNGTIDDSFGSNGIVVVRHFVEGNGATSAALQTDGKILVGGTVNTKPGAKAAVFRFNSNGALDSSFDNDGVVVTSLGTSHDRVGALILRGSGKIVAVGTSVVSKENVIHYALIGFNQDGSLDQGFGSGGISRAGNPATGIVRGAAEQPDGKIVVVGSKNMTTDGSIVGFQTARFNSNGSPDASFGNRGSTSLVVKHYAEAAAVAIQSDGCLVIAGGGSGLQSTPLDFTLLRYVGGNSALPATAVISGQVIRDSSWRLSGGTRIKVTGGPLISPIYTRANPFGYFRFADLPTDQDYQITVDSKSYVFMRPTADVHLIDNVSDLYFVGSVRLQ
jgi:uncharacterized delta-60 repeat protein